MNKKLYLTFLCIFIFLLNFSGGLFADKQSCSDIKKNNINNEFSIKHVIIPEDKGIITEKHAGAGKKTIFYIQDIHCQYDAQLNEADIISFLQKKHELNLILVEGGSGNVNLSHLRSLASMERRREVADDFLKKGKISAEEYLDIASDNELLISGIEDEVLYNKNYKAYIDVELIKTNLRPFINELIDAAGRIRQKTFPENFLDLDEKREAYRNGEISLNGYCCYLEKIALAEDIDLTFYPSVISFMRLDALEENFTFKAVSAESSFLVDKIESILPEKELKDYLTGALKAKLQPESTPRFLSETVKIAEKYQVPESEYKNISAYLEYRKLSNSFDPAIIEDQIKQLERKIACNLLKTPEQHFLEKVISKLDIFDRLLSLKLSPDEYACLKTENTEFQLPKWQKFIKGLIEKYQINTNISENIPLTFGMMNKLDVFYDIACQRDNVFVENILTAMDHNSINRAIVIAGGFHKPGIVKRLKENNISCVVIMPRAGDGNYDVSQYHSILEYKQNRLYSMRPRATRGTLVESELELALKGVSEVSNAFSNTNSRSVKKNRDGYIQSKGGKAPEQIVSIRENHRELLEPVSFPGFDEIKAFINEKIDKLESKAGEEAPGRRKDYLEQSVASTREGLELLEELYSEGRIFSFKAIVYNREDYVLGFGNEEEIGIAVELLGLDMHLLAELLLHEAMCFEVDHWQAMRIQEELFDENYYESDRWSTSLLKKHLRGLIDRKARTKNGVDPFEIIKGIVETGDDTELLYIDEGNYGRNFDGLEHYFENTVRLGKTLIFTGDLGFYTHFEKMLYSRDSSASITNRSIEDTLKAVVSKDHGVVGLSGIPNDLVEAIKSAASEYNSAILVDLIPLVLIVELDKAGYGLAREMIAEFIRTGRIYVEYDVFTALVQLHREHIKEHRKIADEREVLEERNRAADDPEFYGYKEGEIQPLSDAEEKRLYSLTSIHHELFEKQRRFEKYLAKIFSMSDSESFKSIVRRYILENDQSIDDLYSDIAGLIKSESDLAQDTTGLLAEIAWDFYLDENNTGEELNRFREFLLRFINKSYRGTVNAQSKIHDIFSEGKLNSCYLAIDVFLRFIPDKREFEYLFMQIKAAPYGQQVMMAFALALVTLEGVREEEVLRSGSDMLGIGFLYQLLGPEARNIYFYIARIHEAQSRGGGFNPEVDKNIIFLTRALDDFGEFPGERGRSWFTGLRDRVHRNASSSDLDVVRELLFFWKSRRLSDDHSHYKNLIQEIPGSFSGDRLERYAGIMNRMLQLLHDDGFIQSLKVDQFLDEMLSLKPEVVIERFKKAADQTIEAALQALEAEKQGEIANKTGETEEQIEMNYRRKAAYVKKEYKETAEKMEYTVRLFFDLTERYGVFLGNIIPRIKGETGEAYDGERELHRQEMLERTEFMRNDYDSLIDVIESEDDQLVLLRLARVRLRIRDHLLFGKISADRHSDETVEKKNLMELDKDLAVLGKEKIVRLLEEVEKCKALEDIDNHVASLVAIGNYMLASGLGGIEFEQLLFELENGTLSYSQLHDLVRAIRSEIHKVTRNINENVRNGARYLKNGISFNMLADEWRKIAKTEVFPDKDGYKEEKLSEEGRQELEDMIIDNLIRETHILSFDQALMRFNDILESQLTQVNDAPVVERGDGAAAISRQFFRFGQPEIIPRKKLLSQWSKKGLNLVKMTEERIPVPPGVILSSRMLTRPDVFQSQEFKDEVEKEIELVQKYSKYPDLKFLLYARSGSAFTLPGLLTTIPNLGMNDREAEDLAEKTGDLWFAYDTYGEFIRAYGVYILGIPEEYFQDVLNIYGKDELSGAQMKTAVEKYKSLVVEKYREILVERGVSAADLPAEFNQIVPDKMIDQVMLAVDSVYESWDSDEARAYRERHRISQEWGTVVILQKGLFGNLAETEEGRISGAGIAALRELPDGREVVQGKFRFRSTGDQLMSRADQNYVLLSNSQRLEDEQTMEELQPELYQELLERAHQLKKIFGNRQQFEFIVELDNLWITQANDDFVTIDYPEFMDLEESELIGRGQGVSAGAFRGWVANSFEKAEELLEKYANEKPDNVDGVVLMLNRVNPELINRIPKGVAICAKVISVHAETLAQKNGIPSVYGVSGMRYDEDEDVWFINNIRMSDGMIISMDGHENQLVYHNSGKIFAGSVPLAEVSDGKTEVERRSPRALDRIRELREQELFDEAMQRKRIALTRFEREILDSLRKYREGTVNRRTIDRYRNNYSQILDKIAVFCKDLDMKLYGEEMIDAFSGRLAVLGLDYGTFKELYEMFDPRGRKAKAALDHILTRIAFSPSEAVTDRENEITVYDLRGNNKILTSRQFGQGSFPFTGSAFIVHPIRKMPELVSFDIDDVLEQMLVTEEVEGIIELFKRIKAMDIKIAITSGNPSLLSWYTAVCRSFPEFEELVDFCEYTPMSISLSRYTSALGIDEDDIVHFGNTWFGGFRETSMVSLHKAGYISVGVSSGISIRETDLFEGNADAVVMGDLTSDIVLDIIKSWQWGKDIEVSDSTGVQESDEAVTERDIPDQDVDGEGHSADMEDTYNAISELLDRAYYKDDNEYSVFRKNGLGWLAELFNTVEKYYGSDSEQWKQIAQTDYLFVCINSDRIDTERPFLFSYDNKGGLFLGYAGSYRGADYAVESLEAFYQAYISLLKYDGTLDVARIGPVACLLKNHAAALHVEGTRLVSHDEIRVIATGFKSEYGIEADRDLVLNDGQIHELLSNEVQQLQRTDADPKDIAAAIIARSSELGFAGTVVKDVIEQHLGARLIESPELTWEVYFQILDRYGSLTEVDGFEGPDVELSDKHINQEAYQRRRSLALVKNAA